MPPAASGADGVGTPWTIALYERAPVSPILVGAGFAGLVLLAFAVASLLGTARISVLEQLAIEALNAVVIGYLPTVTFYGLRGAERDLRALRPVLGLSDAAFDATIEGLRRFDLRWLSGFTALGFAIGLSFPFTAFYWAADAPPPTSVEFVYHALRNGVLVALAMRTGAIEIAIARRFSALGTGVTVDLLDPRPLAPFARRGVRSVLRLLGFTSLVSLLMFGPWPRELAYLGLTVSVCAAAVVFVLPLLGAHRRMRDARSAELDRLRAEIRASRDALAAGGGAPPRLADLAALRGMVEAAPTWPLDVPTLLRFGIYVALGAGSWLGSALVERLVSKLFG